MALSLNSPPQSAKYISSIRQCVLQSNDQHLLGQFKSHSLDSAFQPIFSLAHKRIVGYEALVRVTDEAGEQVPSPTIFERETEDSSHIFLDRLCRYIHLSNFRRIKDNLNWLFLNVSPRVVASGMSVKPFFSDLLEEYAFPAHRVVIEIVEYPIKDQDRILETVGFYRDLGCLIAIDDFGAGHSNFERIWMLRPHIVKLDRSMIIQAASQRKIRQLLPGIISLLHQAGSLIIIEGIETEEQALIAMESDADFVQGYFFAKPSVDIDANKARFQGFDNLFNRFKAIAMQQENDADGLYDRYKPPFAQAIWAIKHGELFEKACGHLLSDPSVVRCYLLQPDGIQIGSTIVSRNSNLESDRRFEPLSDAKSADWFRRYYLRRAIIHPNQLQITRPYLSITGSHMCVTLSMMFSTDQGRMVLCCDLNKND